MQDCLYCLMITGGFWVDAVRFESLLSFIVHFTAASVTSHIYIYIYISHFFPHEFQHMDHVYFFFVGKFLLVNKCNYGTKTEYDMSYLEIHCFSMLKFFKNVWSTVLTINKSPKS